MSWRQLIIEVYLALVILWSGIRYLAVDPRVDARWVRIVGVAVSLAPVMTVMGVALFVRLWQLSGELGKVGE